MKTFSELGLNNRITELLNRNGFSVPTEVQEKAIPIALEGRDIIVRSKTGTGKTYAFMLPILEKAQPAQHPSALILAPTRELALQTATMSRKVDANGRGIVVVYGGASINVQIQELGRRPAIVVGTPGRVLDLIERGSLDISKIQFMVLDEADMMFDMGFIDDIERILALTPKEKQTMLLSATMPEAIVNIARKHMRDPVKIIVGKEEDLVVSTITHFYAVADYRGKFASLLAYIKRFNPSKAIIFARTKHMADILYYFMKDHGFDVILMHGGLTQAKREHSLGAFRKGAKFMIATNVAARGLDISGISDIINFDVPEDPNLYVHRSGRSARMNTDGRSFTLINESQRDMITQIKNLANIRIERLELDTKEFANAMPHMQRERRFAGGEGRSRGFREHGEERGREGFRHGRDRGRRPTYRNDFSYSRR
ncbi:MAG: DEAD/DEAH box helicase [Candidatus Micrarchaeaceae archaeon]